ncbi:MAG: class I SAM-dependent methyltransferase [Candidatus Diapherotrites archaeon]
MNKDEIFFDRWWAKHWIAEESFRVNLMVSMAGGNKAARVIDLGCGNGVFLKKLKEMGFYNLYGVDYSQTAVKNLSKEGFNVIKLDLSKNFSGKLSQKFDLVLVGELLEHLPEPKKFILETKKIIKKGGRLIISTPNKDWWPNYFFKQYYRKGLSLSSAFGHSTHISFFSLKELKSLIENSNFRIIKVKGIGAETRLYNPSFSLQTLRAFIYNGVLVFSNLLSCILAKQFSSVIIILAEKK